MPKLNLKQVEDYINEQIAELHQKRLKKLENLTLDSLLTRKNPYLFRSKNILTATELVNQFLDAFLSSQEETIFGNFLERVAIFINSQVYGGWKSSARGIDLEFVLKNTHYIVSIKSGPNWGNSSQIKKMRENFATAQKILRGSGGHKLHIQPVNGCCYGRVSKTDQGDYFKYCGQEFWKFISGRSNLYLIIMNFLSKEAKERMAEIERLKRIKSEQFIQEMLERFCDQRIINWEKLVKFNSSAKNK